MHLLVVLGNGLDVGIPAVLSSHLLNSSLLIVEHVDSIGESLVTSLSEIYLVN
jgi:hypothetical protein